MSRPDLDAMAFEDLWVLHEEITKVLSAKIMAEKLELEKRLAQLNPPPLPAASGAAEPRAEQHRRRRYPKVGPKYRNPLRSSETWSGRGKQPRWVQLALQSGQRLEEFEITDSRINDSKTTDSETTDSETTDSETTDSEVTDHGFADKN